MRPTLSPNGLTVYHWCFDKRCKGGCHNQCALDQEAKRVELLKQRELKQAA